VAIGVGVGFVPGGIKANLLLPFFSVAQTLLDASVISPSKGLEMIALIVIFAGVGVGVLPGVGVVVGEGEGVGVVLDETKEPAGGVIKPTLPVCTSSNQTAPLAAIATPAI